MDYLLGLGCVSRTPLGTTLRAPTRTRNELPQPHATSHHARQHAEETQRKLLEANLLTLQIEEDQMCAPR